MTEPRPDDTAPTWERLSALFEATISLDVAERRSYLERVCAHDMPLRLEVEALLQAADGAPEFLRQFTDAIVSPSLEAALTTDLVHAPVGTPLDSWRGSHAPMERVRHYEILERLGAGGMGVVYRGRDTRLDRDVAMKFVSPDRIADPAARRRLLREAQAASSLADANVCAVHAIEDLDDGGICVVMSYCVGGTLRDRLRAGPLSVNDSLAIAVQVASGLACAHRNGIVHRDIKPANIGFDETGAARILDFGIAWRRGAEVTADGALLAGTLSYLAPEQLRGDAIGASVDVWALGVTLHEMLTGRRPFTGDTDAALLHAILEEQVAPLLFADGTPIPAAVDRAVRAMLAKQPELRPADGDVLVRLLRACSDPASTVAAVEDTSAATVAPTNTAPQPLAIPASASAPYTPGWGPRATVVVALCAAIGAGVWTTRTRDRAVGAVTSAATSLEVARSDTPLPTIAVLPFTIRGSATLDYLVNGMVDLVTPAFDATGLVRGVDPNAVIGAAGRLAGGALDSAAAQQLAASLNAERYVVGSIVTTGPTLTLRATLHRAAGGEAGRAQVVVADVASLAGGIDQLVRRLIASELQAPGDTVAGVAAVTTSSATALRAYLDGERELRDARPAAAVAHFQRAVAEDSTFAIAWYKLARAARWSEVDSLNAHATERAYALVSTLPLRLQDLVRGYHAFRLGSPREAERRFRRIVSDYPTDVDGWMLLGETMYHNNAYYGRPTDEATAAFRKVMALDPRNREVTVYLMGLAARADRRGELDTLFRMYFDPNSAGEQPGIRQTYLALHARRTRAAQASRSGAERIDDPGAALTALRRADASARDLEAMRQFATRLIAPDVEVSLRVHGLLALATLDVADGRWSAAEVRLREAAALDADATLMHRALLLISPRAPESASADGATVLRDVRQSLRAAIGATRTTGDGSAVVSDGLSARERDHLRRYLVGMLSLRLGETGVVEEMQRALAGDRGSVRLALPLSAALRGHLARARGALAEAEAAFAESIVDVPVDVRERAPVLEQHADRLAAADVLSRNGNAASAVRWFDSLRDGPALMASPYLAAAEAGRRKAADVVRR